MQLNKCSVEFIPYVRTRCPVQSSEDIELKTPKRKQPSLWSFLSAAPWLIAPLKTLIIVSVKTPPAVLIVTSASLKKQYIFILFIFLKRRHCSQIIERLTDTVTTERSTGPPSHVVNRCSFHGDLVSPLSGRHGYYSSEQASWLVESRMELGCCACGWVGGRLREQNRFDMRFQSHGWVAEPDVDSPPVSLSRSLSHADTPTDSYVVSPT